MLLYEDSSLILELYKNHKILCVRWLDAYPFRMFEFELAFHIFIERIEKHKIRKILTNSNKTIIHLPDDEFKSVISLIQSGLAHTNVEKMARIYVDKSKRDLQCIEYFKEMMNEMQLKIDFCNFDDRKTALLWLKES